MDITVEKLCSDRGSTTNRIIVDNRTTFLRYIHRDALALLVRHLILIDEKEICFSNETFDS